MAADFDDPSALEHVDTVGVHDRRQPVRDEDRDHVADAETSRMVRLISSSVSESSADVASSNTSRCGWRSSARAIERRCFSPPEIFMPPSPITVSRPLSARREASRGRPVQHVDALGVGGVRADEEQVLANGPGEELSVLRNEADSLAEPVEIDASARTPL